MRSQIRAIYKIAALEIDSWKGSTGKAVMEAMTEGLSLRSYRTHPKESDALGNLNDYVNSRH